MRMTTIFAAFFIVIGLVMFTVVMSINGWDFSKLNTVRYETNNYEISEEFANLSIKTDTADIVFALSDDGRCKVECYEEEKAKHSVAVTDGTLTVKMINKKRWYDYIGINFSSPKITVYLPKAEYSALWIRQCTGDIEVSEAFRFERVDISLDTGDADFFASASGLIQIKTSTGEICVKNASAGAVDLSTSTGEILVSNVTCEGDMRIDISTGDTVLADIVCKNLSSSVNTGDISLRHVVAGEKFSLRTDTGNVTFDGCDAGEIFAQTDTGDVTGDLLTDKIFIAQADTGSVDVPKTLVGGKCEIITKTGNIRITVKQS